MNKKTLNDLFKEVYGEEIKRLMKETLVFNPTYTVPKSGVYQISGNIKMAPTGCENPGRISLPEGLSINDCIIPWDEDFDQDDTDCKHNWRNYIGFTESFKYCTKCDERREIDEEL